MLIVRRAPKSQSILRQVPLPRLRLSLICSLALERERMSSKTLQRRRVKSARFGKMFLLLPLCNGSLPQTSKCRRDLPWHLQNILGLPCFQSPKLIFLRGATTLRLSLKTQDVVQGRQKIVRCTQGHLQLQRHQIGLEFQNLKAQKRQCPRFQDHEVVLRLSRTVLRNHQQRPRFLRLPRDSE